MKPVKLNWDNLKALDLTVKRLYFQIRTEGKRLLSKQYTFKVSGGWESKCLIFTLTLLKFLANEFWIVPLVFSDLGHLTESSLAFFLDYLKQFILLRTFQHIVEINEGKRLFFLVNV